MKHTIYQMKDIKNYEGLYAIDTMGRIWSYRNKKFLNTTISKSGNTPGYEIITLNTPRKTFRIHRLVAEAFIPNPYKYDQVNHKDENKLNNSVENLEWCNAQYNVDYSQSFKVQCIETGEIFKSAHHAERSIGLYGRHISDVCNGKRQTSGGYHWKYIK